MDKFLRDNHLTLGEFGGFPVSEDFVYEPGPMDRTWPEGFLHQAGNLSPRPGSFHGRFHQMDYPNREARFVLARRLADRLFGAARNSAGFRLELNQALV